MACLIDVVGVSHMAGVVWLFWRLGSHECLVQLVSLVDIYSFSGLVRVGWLV